MLTTTITRRESPELLRNEIDQRIITLRPMATPLDQLSRYAASRHSGSMTVDYYAVASRADHAKITRIGARDGGNSSVILAVDNPDAFEPSDTIIIPEALTDSGRPMAFYVSSVENNDLHLLAINTTANPTEPGGIKADMEIIRMGRAAAELDVQTAQFEALPKKCQNYCQIFKAQIEQSTLMRAANKEVGWTLSDQEEVAIYDMRLGMERSFLFGSKARITDPLKKSEIFLTGGIWNQAAKSATYSHGKLTSAEWLKVMSTAFTGHAGSARKILFAGTGLVEQLSLMDGQQRVMLPGDVVTRWGLDFTEMHSKFGTLYVIHSEVMDSCGHADDGLIIDPEYLTKYIHVPFTATTLDLRTSGQRNTEAVVLTEVSCLVLRYPEAHVRVTATAAD